MNNEIPPFAKLIEIITNPNLCDEVCIKLNKLAKQEKLREYNRKFKRKSRAKIKLRKMSNSI